MSAVVELEFFPDGDPTATSLGTLTEEDCERVEIYVPHRGVGSGLIEIDRRNIDPDWVVPGTLVKVTYPVISPNPVWAFFLDEAAYKLLNETDDQTITIGGGGPLSALRGARLPIQPTAPGQPNRGDFTFEDVWTWKHEPYGAIAKRMIEEGQNQDGTPLRHVTTDFTRNLDSSSNGWAEVADEYETPIGTDIYEGCQAMEDAGDFLLVGTPELLIHAYESYGTDRTSATFAAGKVRITPENMLTEAERRAHGFGAWTHLIGRDKDGDYFLEVSPDYDSSKPARYGYIDITETNDDVLVEKIGEYTLKHQREGIDTVEVELTPGDDELNGRYKPFDHYKPGDRITYHTGTGDHDYNNRAMRIHGMRIVVGVADQTDNATLLRSLHIVLELNAGTDADGSLISPSRRATSSSGGGGKHPHPQPCRAMVTGAPFAHVETLGANATDDGTNYDSEVVAESKVERVSLSLARSVAVGQSIVVGVGHSHNADPVNAVWDDRGNTYTLAADHRKSISGDQPHALIYFTNVTVALSPGDKIYWEVGVGTSLLTTLETDSKVIAAELFSGTLSAPAESGTGSGFNGAPSVAVGGTIGLLVAFGINKGGASGFPDSITGGGDWTAFAEASSDLTESFVQNFGGFRINDPGGETWSGTIDQSRDWAMVGATFDTTGGKSFEGEGHPDTVGTGNRWSRCGHGHDVHRDTAPTAGDDETLGYHVGNVWCQLDDLETPTAIVGEWRLVDASAGAAIWLAGGSGVTDHGALTGLADDDHPQYATNAEFDNHDARHANGGADELAIESLPTAETDPALVLSPDGAGGVEFRAETGGGASDHGALSGLGDDDHPQYATNAEFDDHSARHEAGGADALTIPLNDLSDVNTAGQADGNFLQRASGVWVPIGSVPADKVSLADAGGNWTATELEALADEIADAIVVAGGSGVPGTALVVYPTIPMALNSTATDAGTNAGFLLPIVIPAPMRIVSLRVHTNTSAIGTNEWGLFDYAVDPTACVKLAGGSGALNSGNPSWSAIAATGAPVVVAPGTYALILKLAPSNTPSVRITATTAGTGLKRIATYTWDNTPDLTTTWVDSANLVHCYLRGEYAGGTDY
ncbi:MAG TPA: hypothetical protein VEW95_09395 [Candidatus Limnocylindrales bacterium]|nr:hypothetical protein [Candidatus Limnocylindrales bacterium]